MGDYYYCGCCVCCLSEKKRNAIAKNTEIDLILAEQKKREPREIKLLLLGSEGSGKTTLMKQMKIIHGKGFSDDERRNYAKLVFQNILQAMSAITEAMNTLKIPYSNPQNEIYAQRFQDQDIHQITQLQRSYVEAIRHLWEDQGFKICYGRRREYQLLDSTEYFIDVLDRIAAEDYIPTLGDILRVQSPSNGITEECVSIENITVRIVNVGGQRGQRNKWIHCFENVTSLIFLASLTEYDQLLENNKDNRMEESLSLFYTTIHSTWFANSSVILFLNKMDLLDEKIQFSDLKTYFPGFQGKHRDVQDAKQFIRELYTQKAVCNENSKILYSHFTCALDFRCTQIIFSAVKETILLQVLNKFKLF
ncbi:guanine nucleotide-binding protein G(q) subunit alpha-like [Pseudorasbora parva]|uniref:guanine nucleotide-binding protein G(q) subunit alpha-like n=1 Tax=Pseudorasbora parva TaxID=51549 RepID=UPI00351DF0B9